MSLKWTIVLAAIAATATARGAEPLSEKTGHDPATLDLQAAALDAAKAEGRDAALTRGALAVPAEEGGGAGSASVILSDALLGLIAGAVVGTGVALIEGGNWGRDIAIGAGAGLVLGGLVGGVSSLSDVGPAGLAHDGMGTARRDAIGNARGLGLGGRF